MIAYLNAVKSKKLCGLGLVTIIFSVVMVCFTIQALAELHSESIWTQSNSFIECPPSHRRMVKSCKRLNKTIINGMTLPEIFGAGYRGAAGTVLELHLDFKETTGDFAIELDGFEYQIRDDIAVQTFPIHAIKEKKSLTAIIKSTVGGDLESVPENYTATVSSVRLILDNSRFQQAIKEKEKLLKVIDASLTTTQDVLNYSAAFNVLKELSSFFYTKITSQSLVDLATEADKARLPELLLRLFSAEQVCYFESATSGEKVCMTDAEKAFMPKLMLAIEAMRIPENWKDSAGNPLSFGEFIAKLAPQQQNAVKISESILKILAAQGTTELKARYEQQLATLNADKRRIELEIMELGKY